VLFQVAGSAFSPFPRQTEMARVCLVQHDQALHPRVAEGDERILRLVADDLGVLPDERVRMLFYVEGPTDVTFLEHVSKLTCPYRKFGTADVTLRIG
jgi:hypothetical protein